MRALIARYGNIAAAEAYQWHRALESPRHTEIDVSVYNRMMAGKTMSAMALDALQQGRRVLQRSLWATLGDALLVMPTVPHVAPALARWLQSGLFRRCEPENHPQYDARQHAQCLRPGPA